VTGVLRATRSRARRLAIHACAAATVGAGIDARGIAGLGPDGLLVLNLHSVSPPSRSLSNPVSPESLDRLVGWLVRHCRVGTFATLTRDHTADDRPGAVLSFDDGYRDFLEYAMPVLNTHGARAIVNVVPACVDSGAPPWNALMVERVLALPDARIAAIRLPDFPRGDFDGGRDGRLRYAVALSRYLKLRPRTERDVLLAELRDQIGGVEADRATPMLSHRDLAEVARHHEIGLHSYDHDSMAFESDEFLRADLARCRTWADAHLPTPSAAYAFPNGSHRETQVRIAEEAELGTILLGGERPSRIAATSHPRITTYGDTERTLRLRIAMAIYARGARSSARTALVPSACATALRGSARDGHGPDARPSARHHAANAAGSK
jgi:peptidoglycan/xylan/chitin deacetylase (PgdA/CDA1 family)